MAKKITRDNYAALKLACDMARDWRGAYVGHPDPEQLVNFDAHMLRINSALKAVRQQIDWSKPKNA